MSIQPLVLHKNYDLQASNTLAVPSRAELYTEIHHDQDINALLAYVQSHNHTAITVLGGGSNVVLPECLAGLTVKMLNRQRTMVSESANDCLIRCGAGDNWHELVMWSVGKCLYGLENLALIPGTVGAAPIQNIGAYGADFSQVCESVEGVDWLTGERKIFSNKACQFAYRDSIFKRESSRGFLITHVNLRLSKQSQVNITYPALRAQLACDHNNHKSQPLTPLAVAEAVIAVRQSKLPDPSQLPNAGSFFKNPIITKTQLAELQKSYPDVVFYPVDAERVKLAAAWLIDHAGWKGKVVNGLSMHTQQALVLTNPHAQSGHGIVDFAEKISTDIQARFGVHLDIEPKLLVDDTDANR